MVLDAPISAAGGTIVAMLTLADEPAGMSRDISSVWTSDPTVIWMGQLFSDEKA